MSTPEDRNGTYQRAVVIDSDTAQGQRVQSDIVALAESCEFSAPELFAIHLAVEEALVNAIKHGNGSDASKKVHIDYGYEVDSKQMRIRIADEGPGFNPADVPDPTDLKFLERPCGRGLLLMRHYMSRIVFSERGNCVEMIKRKGERAGGAGQDGDPSNIAIPI